MNMCFKFKRVRVKEYRQYYTKSIAIPEKKNTIIIFYYCISVSSSPGRRKSPLDTSSRIT